MTLKTTTILIIMAILMLPLAFAASSENDEQTVAFGSQVDEIRRMDINIFYPEPFAVFFK